MRFRTRLLGMSAGLAIMGGALLAPSSALAIELPEGAEISCGLAPTDNCLIFGDFIVFSLALLNYQASGLTDTTLNPGDPFYVGSQPGHLKDELVVASQPSGVRNNQDFYADQADNGYDITTTEYNSGGSDREVFRMGDLPPQDDPLPDSPDITNDHTNLWDMEISALGGLDPVFFFNLNDTGEQTLTGEDLLGWMQVKVYDAGGATIGTFTLDGSGDGVTGGFPGITSLEQDEFSDILPNLDDLWAYVHGKICVAADGTVSFPPCAAGTTLINQHLGADTAAFAMISLGLNSALDAAGATTLSVDLRLAYANNGFEQLFILPQGTTTEIPEPSTIALFGAGLLGLGWLFRRRRKHV